MDHAEIVSMLIHLGADMNLQNEVSNSLYLSLTLT
jgi:hypothetical protein